jgi:glycosyltransferase involved in cell wall biosynthesis
MSRCRAVLFPCYEDFGIVPVEAMAAGLPVVAYREGGGSESVLPECGVLMRELTVDELVRAIQEMEGRHWDPTVLRTRAAEFDVEVFRANYRSAVEAALQR